MATMYPNGQDAELTLPGFHGQMNDISWTI